jgi:hypothetical protein
VDGPVLILHNTTEFVYYGESAQGLGVVNKGFKGRAESYARGIAEGGLARRRWCTSRMGLLGENVQNSLRQCERVPRLS